MDCYIGIDLGSTTTKAVVIDRDERILGKGITNSRSNYEVACQVAKEEAEINTRFAVLKDYFLKNPNVAPVADDLMKWVIAKYSLASHKKQLDALKGECEVVMATSPWTADEKGKYSAGVLDILTALHKMADEAFKPDSEVLSEFFRDTATTRFLKEGERVVKSAALSYDRLVGIFDKAILRVENNNFSTYFSEYLAFSKKMVLLDPQFKKFEADISKEIDRVIDLKFHVISTVGTGYGRLTLPFAKSQIRSEILCHGLGAHKMFPNTRTVLDIGGQDTKAIQIDGNGIVTNFQMNDRCAAGCGRYLGYIADEMNVGVAQLGPMAMQSTKAVRINSTCTVFAGAELRERISLGEKREDILAGLHRAIILRAMSLLARSGGVSNEFTFTGGVGRNEAAVQALRQLVFENYGKLTINISHDSIYMGALGAALFALRDAAVKVVEPSQKSVAESGAKL